MIYLKKLEPGRTPTRRHGAHKAVSFDRLGGIDDTSRGPHFYSGRKGLRSPQTLGETPLRNTFLAAAILLGGLAGLPQPTLAENHPCTASVDQRLAELGVDKSDVKKLRFGGRYQSRGQSSRLVGFEAWMDLGSCSQGQLVIVVSRQCRHMTEFTTGSCKVAGVDD